MTREIDRRLRELRSELRGLSWRERRRVLAEARDHLLSSLEHGCDERQAIELLGPGTAFRGFPPRRHGARRVAIGAPLLLAGLALAPSLDRAVWRSAPSPRPPTPAQAPTPPAFPPKGASTRRCVAACNAPANARFRALAVRDRVSRANVYPAFTGKVTRDKKGHLHLGPVHFSGCGVNLWLAPAASLYQRFVQVQGKIGPH